MKKESKKIQKCYRILFEYLLEDLVQNKETSYIHRNFLKSKSKEYLDKTNDVQKAIDYISGMTDNYLVRTFEKVIVPKSIEMR